MERASAKHADPPEILSDLAKAHWRDMFPVLRACGLLKITDLPAFAIYCSIYGRWVEAEKALNGPDGSRLLKTPNGLVQANPWLTIHRQASELLLRYQNAFGMNPSALASVGGKGEPPENPSSLVERRVGGKFAGLIGRGAVRE